MINNRTSSRRRGRGGSRSGSPSRAPDGNRLDSRARGNASQLHEKYKGLARDAQNQGDRMMQEYYLQFADHYFRILMESNARRDDYRRPDDEAEGETASEGGPAETREAGGERAETDERSQGPSDRSRRTRRPSSSRPREEESGRDGEERIAADRLPASITASNDAGDRDGGESDSSPDQGNGRSRRRAPRTSRADDSEAEGREAGDGPHAAGA